MGTVGFTKVKGYLNELGLVIAKEVVAEDLFVIQDEESGINSLVIDVEDPIVILEQFIMNVPTQAQERFYRRLLQMNCSLVHGAFVLDQEGQRVYFRDTLQLQNLDLNELEGSIKALSLGLAEFGEELIEFSKH